MVRAMVRAGCTGDLLEHATRELVQSVDQESLEGEEVRLLHEERTKTGEIFDFFFYDSDSAHFFSFFFSSFPK
jgi:hypothetical protein